jgi:hypothetical protein
LKISEVRSGISAYSFNVKTSTYTYLSTSGGDMPIVNPLGTEMDCRIVYICRTIVSGVSDKRKSASSEKKTYA